MTLSSKGFNLLGIYILLRFSVTDTGNHQTLKSNIRIMQTETMKEYIFYQVDIILLYNFFQQNNFNLFLPLILTFDSLRTVAELTKIAMTFTSTINLVL